ITSVSPVTYLVTSFLFVTPPPPPRSPPFPYTTLFRSEQLRAAEACDVELARVDRDIAQVAIEYERAGRGTAGGRERHQLAAGARSEEHTSELQSLTNLVCRLLLEKKKRATIS